MGHLSPPACPRTGHTQNQVKGAKGTGRSCPHGPVPGLSPRVGAQHPAMHHQEQWAREGPQPRAGPQASEAKKWCGARARGDPVGRGAARRGLCNFPKETAGYRVSGMNPAPRADRLLGTALRCPLCCLGHRGAGNCYQPRRLQPHTVGHHPRCCQGADQQGLQGGPRGPQASLQMPPAPPAGPGKQDMPRVQEHAGDRWSPSPTTSTWSPPLA